MSENKNTQKIREYFVNLKNQIVKYKQYLVKHKKDFRDVSVVFLISSFLLISSLFFSYALNVEALKALVQAEATFFGFFGIMLVYTLKHYDEELVKLKEKSDAISISGEDKTKLPFTRQPKGEFFRDYISEIQDKKKELVKSGINIGMFLLGSMLISVWLIGSIEPYLSESITSEITIKTIRFFSLFTPFLFLMSIYVFFDVLNTIAREI